MSLNIRKKYIQFIIIAGRILFLPAIIIILTTCKPNQPEKIQELTNREELPGLSLYELNATITDSGALKYRFITAEMLQFDQRKEPTTEFPQGLHLFVFDDNENIDAQIKCKKAIYYQNEELWELLYDVESINTNGDVINTEQMFWDSKNGKIYSDEFIKITTETQIITGYGFESDEKLENYTIKNVSGILEIEENKEQASN